MAVNPLLSERERAVLGRAVVGIAGAGGLGSNCAMHLARAGIGRLRIADFDRVTPGNLNRQFFFADQVGELKTEALAANLRRIAPELEVTLFSERLTAVAAGEFFRDCDIVVEALDTVGAKRMLIMAMLAGKKKIVAASGIAGWGRSNDIRVRRVGESLWLAGDGERGVEGEQGLPPQSPRVGIAAAVEANTVAALLLGEEI